MTRIQGKVVRANNYGLIVVQDDAGHQYAVTTDKLRHTPPDADWTPGSRVEVTVQGDIVIEAQRT